MNSLKKLLTLSKSGSPVLFENRIVRSIFSMKKRRSDIFEYERFSVVESALRFLRIIRCEGSIGQTARDIRDCIQLTYIRLIPEYQKRLNLILLSRTRQEIHRGLTELLKDITYTNPNEEMILDLLVPKSTLEYLLYDKGITSIKQMSRILNTFEVDIKRQFEYMKILQP